MIDKRIIRFFRKHHVLTIATSHENEPWCASCFYVYLEEENALVFTSDLKTRHGQDFLKNPEKYINSQKYIHSGASPNGLNTGSDKAQELRPYSAGEGNDNPDI